jgi:hypothetical protein
MERAGGTSLAILRANSAFSGIYSTPTGVRAPLALFPIEERNWLDADLLLRPSALHNDQYRLINLRPFQLQDVELESWRTAPLIVHDAGAFEHHTTHRARSLVVE